MCGITGIYYKDKNRKVEITTLQKANDKMVHRGPDDKGYLIDGNVGLAMRRLSIIDVSGGKQPIYNENRDCAIVYNGEFYNHEEIRVYLEKKGHIFSTKTDTEVIIHLYEEKGPKLLEYMNGMYAFAIWDSRKKRLFLARDRLGIKPLFYYEDNEKFIFASEIKSILAYENVRLTIDNLSLFDYLTFNYIPSPRTIYREIRKLPPAYFIIIENNNTLIKKYWEVTPNVDYSITFNKAKDTLEELIYDSINLRLMSEVPLGAFLSGGIDSSTICYFITKYKLKDNLKTFSVGFDVNNRENELPFSKETARRLNTDHHTQIVTYKAVEMLDETIKSIDEPMADTSNIPTYLLSKYTRQFVTVALSGDGGDELFAGYERQIILNILKRFEALPCPFKELLQKTLFSKLKFREQKDSRIESIKRILHDISTGYYQTYTRWLTNFNPQILKFILTDDLYHQYTKYNTYRIVEDYFKLTGDPINQSLLFELNYYLPDDLLVKVDRMSMAHSLEVRVPFLDHRLVEFAFSLPVEYKIKGKTTKFILRKLMQGKLPRKVLMKPKQGFTPPIKKWISSDLKDYIHDSILIKDMDYFFKRKAINKLLSKHQQSIRDYQYQIWNLLIFLKWLNNNKQRVKTP